MQRATQRRSSRARATAVQLRIGVAAHDRYELARRDALAACASADPSNVVLATGNGFADALAAGPYASDVFTSDGPAAILLTNDRIVPPAVYDYMRDHAGVLAAVGGQAVSAAAGRCTSPSGRAGPSRGTVYTQPSCWPYTATKSRSRNWDSVIASPFPSPKQLGGSWFPTSTWQIEPPNQSATNSPLGT